MKSVSICEGLEGRTVDGKFPLLEWVGGWAHRCVFLTVRQALQTANIKLIHATGKDADAYLAKWEVARTLAHPFVVQMMETGRCAIEGKDLVYVVTEKADAFLSEIIPRKALDPDKGKGILDPIVDALSFLHEKGLVHGRVRPSNIVQVADQWKLAVDELVCAGEPPKLIGGPGAYDAPEVSARNFTPAADVWSLGIIAVEAFERRTPVWDPAAKGDPTVPDSLPAPYLEIARRCLRREPAKRCSIAEVKALLAAESLPSKAEPVPVEEARNREPKIPPAEPVYPFGKVEPAELTPRSRLFADLDEDDERKSHVGLILLGILVLLGAGAYVAVRQHWIQIPWSAVLRSSPPANQPSPPPQAPAAAPEESKSTPPADQTASQSQTPPEMQGTAATGQQAPGAQPSAPPSAEEPKEAKPQAKEAPKAESAAKQESSMPRVANAEGAVIKRVLPNVAPGAIESMRRPVEVEVRVSVNEAGAVSNAEYMTQGPGNYFARIAREAARSWKFRPPEKEGQPQASVWNLRFRFDRRNTEVTASELR